MKDSTMNNRVQYNYNTLTSQAHPQGLLLSQTGLGHPLPGRTPVLPCALRFSPLDKMSITQIIDAALKILGESSEDFDGDEEDVATNVLPFFPSPPSN